MIHLNFPTHRLQMISGLFVGISLILSACAPMAGQKSLYAPASAAIATSVPATITAAATDATIPTSAPQPTQAPAATILTTVPQPTQPPAATAVPATALETAGSPASPTATGAAVLPLESKKNPRLGKLLATAGGMTLYTFGKDTAGVSACTTSPCTDYWPPLTVSAAPTADPDIKGALGTITRPDGSLQVTFNGLPLYTFAQDNKPGDANGDGVNNFGGVWRVVSLGSAPKTPPSGGGMGGGGYHY